MIRVTDMIMTIAGSTAAMSLDALPAPVVVGDSIEVEWSRPTVLSSADPTTLTFEMIRPAWSKISPPAKDAPIELTGMITHEPGWWQDLDDVRETVFKGWIDSITQHPRERGTDLTGLTRFTITATCAIGVLSRMKIGAPPWPRETPLQRMLRIYNIAPQCFSSSPATWLDVMPGGLLVERDVDSTPAMDVLKAAAHPDYTWLCLEKETGLIALADRTGGVEGDVIVNVTNSDKLRVSHNSAGGVIDAGHVMPDTDRTQTWGTGLSTVTVSHYLHGNTSSAAFTSTAQRSRTYGLTTAPGQSLTISSDRIEGSAALDESELSDLPFEPFPPLVEIAQTLLAAGADDAPALESVTLPLAEIMLSDSAAARRMLHVGPGRFERLAFTGLEFGLPMGHVVMGGRLSLSVHDEQTLELNLAPIAQAGVSPLTYGDMGQHPAVTIEAFGGGEAIYTLAGASRVSARINRN